MNGPPQNNIHPTSHAGKNEPLNYSLYATIIYGIYGLSLCAPIFLFFQNPQPTENHLPYFLPYPIFLACFMVCIGLCLVILLAALLRRAMSFILLIACIHLALGILVYILDGINASLSHSSPHVRGIIFFFCVIPLVVIIVFFVEMRILRARGSRMPF